MFIFNFIREKIKKHGWRAAVVIFFYYLIRDLTLYVAIPYFILNK